MRHSITEKDAHTAAALLRLQVHIVNVAAERDIDAAFDDLAGARTAGLVVLPDTLFIDLRRRLSEITAARKLPAIYSNRLYVAAGGLMCYGSSPIDAFSRSRHLRRPHSARREALRPAGRAGGQIRDGDQS